MNGILLALEVGREAEVVGVGGEEDLLVPVEALGGADACDLQLRENGGAVLVDCIVVRCWGFLCILARVTG